MTLVDDLTQEILLWTNTPAVSLLLSSFLTHPGLQPRDPYATRRLEAGHEARQSDRQLEDLTRVLKSRKTKMLAPMLVALVEGKYYIVDGHHRLKAYKRSDRSEAPASVRSMSLKHAVRLSRLVNIEGRSLAMTPGQKAECAWQHLADITRGGHVSLADLGTSQRQIKEAFGVGSKSTIGTMAERLLFANEVKSAGTASGLEVNSFTGWPTWACIKKQLHEHEKIGSHEEIELAHIQRLAAKIAAMIEDTNAIIVKAAFRQAMAEAKEDADEFDESSPF